jgi:CDP-glucose 4,6-dehydratase
MEISKEFWSGKRVFITGHTGFKGGWLCLWLEQLGAEVTGYALEPPTSPSLFEVAQIAQGMNSVIGDIRNVASLETAMRVAAPEIVMHMAAQPLVRQSYIDPIETYSTNVMGTVHLLEVIRKIPSVRAVVNVTSDKCYENREWIWAYREDEALGGYDPYSNSKGCAELVASAYRTSFFNPLQYDKHGVALASARAGNVIGGGDWAVDRLIPDILRAVSKKTPIMIRNPHAIRPWQHVLEPLSGYLLLASNLYQHGTAFAEAWNFGPLHEDARPVSWIVEKMTDLWGAGASWQLDDAHHPHEAHYLKLDCSKAHTKLNWHPRWSLENSLEEIIAWHRHYLEGRDMREKTISQIEKFIN